MLRWLSTVDKTLLDLNRVSVDELGRIADQLSDRRDAHGWINTQQLRANALSALDNLPSIAGDEIVLSESEEFRSISSIATAYGNVARFGTIAGLSAVMRNSIGMVGDFATPVAPATAAYGNVAIAGGLAGSDALMRNSIRVAAAFTVPVAQATVAYGNAAMIGKFTDSDAVMRKSIGMASAFTVPVAQAASAYGNAAMAGMIGGLDAVVGNSFAMTSALATDVVPASAAYSNAAMVGMIRGSDALMCNSIGVAAAFSVPVAPAYGNAAMVGMIDDFAVGRNIVLCNSIAMTSAYVPVCQGIALGLTAQQDVFRSTQHVAWVSADELFVDSYLVVETTKQPKTIPIWFRGLLLQYILKCAETLFRQRLRICGELQRAYEYLLSHLSWHLIHGAHPPDFRTSTAFSFSA